MERASGQRRHRVGRIAVTVLGGLFLVGTLLPLVVRGPVARWLVARATASRCGTFQISGGHLGWAAVWELLLGRPVDLVIEDAQITGADGQVVFAAARFEATLAVRGAPFRVTLSDVLMARGSWRLALLPHAIGTADAFRAVPEEGRAGCLDPFAKRKPGRPGRSSGSIAIRNLRFRDVDIDLAFPTWELELGRANAAGSLSAGGGGPPLLFEVRDVVAAAGALRIGRRGDAWTARVPFDAVNIPHVGVTTAHPSDLALEVASAGTGRARLAGRATFRNIFAPRAGQRPPGPPGLEVDARWTRFGAALSSLDATWRPQGAWATHLDGDLHATIRGPFSAMTGALEIVAGKARISARVSHGAVADLKASFAGVETGWMLDPALRPLLGGHLCGSLHATAHLWPTFEGLDAQIADADLRLDRRRVRAGPRHFTLRIGTNGESKAPCEGPLPKRAPDTLTATVSTVGLSEGVLALEGLRADWIGLSARLDARVAFSASGGAPTAPSRPARSQVEARGTLAVAALEDWVPGGAVSGPLRLSLAAQGTLARVALRLKFAPPTAVGVLGQRFLLPRRLDATWIAGGDLIVSRFRLRREGGGTIDVGGQLGAGNKVKAHAVVRAYPVAGIPGVGRSGKLGPLKGTLSADLSLAGALARPTLHGRLAVGGLAFVRRPLGDLRATLRLGAETGEVDATIDPGLTLHARVRRRPALAIDATVSVRERAVGPWLPAPLTGAPLVASGDLQVGYHGGALSAAAQLAVSGPGLSGVTVDGRLDGLAAHAHVGGEIDVARWPRLWSRALKSATGTVAVDLTIAPTLFGTGLAGHVRIARPLVLRWPRWPSPIGVAAGGQVTLAGDALTLQGVAVTTTGLSGAVSGRATLDLRALARTRLALRLQAELDAARFPVHLPAGVVARGRAAIDAQIGGTLGAAPGPRIDGIARLENLTVQLSPTTPSARANGVVEAHGDRLRSEGLRVDIAGVGQVAIGRAGAPASAELASLSPFRLGHIDVPFRAKDLKIGNPGSKLYIPELDVDLRLIGDGRDGLRIAGQVAIARGSYDASRGGGGGGGGAPSPKPRVSGPWYHALPPHLTLDLELRGTNRGMQVAVPVLPDVAVDFRCHLVATDRGARWSGDLRGNGLYGRAAVAIADWFSDSDLRKCQLTR